MKRFHALTVCALWLAVLTIHAQPPMPTDSWPSYNGDFSGRRFSPASKINAANVKSLSLAWNWKLTASGGSSSNIRSTPLMIDGVIYLSTEDNAFAVDAR